ncbi:unnamed protein product [Caenorhabditis brenneri]
MTGSQCAMCGNSLQKPVMYCIKLNQSVYSLQLLYTSLIEFQNAMENNPSVENHAASTNSLTTRAHFCVVLE